FGVVEAVVEAADTNFGTHTAWRLIRVAVTLLLTRSLRRAARQAALNPGPGLYRPLPSVPRCRHSPPQRPHQVADDQHVHQDPSCLPEGRVASPARSSSSTTNSRYRLRRWRRGCSSCPAAAASQPPSCSARSAPSSASAPTRSSPATPASHPSTPAQANTNATASTAAATN